MMSPPEKHFKIQTVLAIVYLFCASYKFLYHFLLLQKNVNYGEYTESVGENTVNLLILKYQLLYSMKIRHF